MLEQIKGTIGQHYEHVPWPRSGPPTACLLFREFSITALLTEVSLVLHLLITSHHPRWTWEAMKKITGANTNYNYTNIRMEL